MVQLVYDAALLPVIVPEGTSSDHGERVWIHVLIDRTQKAIAAWQVATAAPNLASLEHLIMVVRQKAAPPFRIVLSQSTQESCLYEPLSGTGDVVLVHARPPMDLQACYLLSGLVHEVEAHFPSGSAPLERVLECIDQVLDPSLKAPGPVITRRRLKGIMVREARHSATMPRRGDGVGTPREVFR
jgi:hypothetical protein